MMTASAYLRGRKATSIAEKALLLSFRRMFSTSTKLTSTMMHHPSLQLCILPYPTTTSRNQHVRHISTSSYCFQRNKDIDSTDLHSLYHEEMKEIESEKDAIFGQSPSPDDTLSNSHDITQLAKAYNDQLSETTTQPHQSTSRDQSPAEEPPTTGDLWDAETREEAYEEREALFQFSQEEKNAWSNDGGMKQINSSHIHMLRHLIKEGPPDKQKEQEQQQQVAISTTTSASESTNQPFSHLNHQGDGVSMVDVGHKQVTRRIATATSSVIFPPEVLSAFQLRTTQDKGQRSSEMIGPKGPIFETAKIAGIMAAKKTSDLIPLCHPLPLDRVNIDIQLIDNKAIIECECRVTHKTGVEMEALTGASVAALTIYDMVKAVSHRVEIGSTVLVGKSGGKSDFRAN